MNEFKYRVETIFAKCSVVGMKANGKVFFSHSVLRRVWKKLDCI